MPASNPRRRRTAFKLESRRENTFLLIYLGEDYTCSQGLSREHGNMAGLPKCPALTLGLWYLCAVQPKRQRGGCRSSKIKSHGSPNVRPNPLAVDVGGIEWAMALEPEEGSRWLPASRGL